MLPMKADLQELMIAEEEIDIITGKTRIEYGFVSLSKFLLSTHSQYKEWNQLSEKQRKKINTWSVASAFAIYISITYAGFGLIIIFFIYGIIIPLRRLKLQNILELLKEVRKHNQIITNLYTLDQLEAVGNPVKINDRVKVIEALKITREGLVRALKTERILRENPNFKPEYFNIDLTSLQAERTMVKAVEYAQLLDDAVQIGVSVQTEMRKLQNNR
jgi:hypothetical protein